MPVDVKYLREHYASLSDEALSEIRRADLVEAAQRVYDEEVGRRKHRPSVHETDSAEEEPEIEPGIEPSDADLDSEDDGAEPDWLDEAAEVLSRADAPGSAPEDMANARDVLEAADIPCYLDLYEIPKTTTASRAPTHLWRLLVPGEFNQRATSVLDRDIFNQEFEAEWRTHLETLSDDELREMKPEVAFCGLFDRVERVTKAYEEEIGRRRLNKNRKA